MTRTEELRVICKKAKRDNLTAEELVEYAKNKREYPKLHEHLWGAPEVELAKEARLARAHRLLIWLRVEVIEGGPTYRAMLHVETTKGYTALHRVLNTVDLAALKLRELMEDIKRARAKLSEFRRLLPDDLADDIEARLKELEGTIEQEVNDRRGKKRASSRS